MVFLPNEHRVLKSTLGIVLQNVLVCGWGDSTFMTSLLHSMDEELPRNSQVTLLNMQRKEDVLSEHRLLPSNSYTCLHKFDLYQMHLIVLRSHITCLMDS